LKLKVFTSRMSNLFAENRLLKFVVAVLAMCLIFNSFMVYRAVKYERVVIVPSKLQESIEFVHGKPNDAYVKDTVRDISSLATIYTPATARKQFEKLLTYYAPEAYPEGSKAWYILAGMIEDAKTSSVFFIQSINLKENTAEIFGELKQFTGDTLFLGETRTYIVEYRFLDGRFQIISFRQKKVEKK
jgi:conjugal transfer pilus assembly protein TraE